MVEEKLGQFAGTTLTNIRIRQRYKNLVKSALLSRVDGIALVYRSNIFWLILSIITALLAMGGGLGADKSGGIIAGGGLLLAAIFLAIYFSTRCVVLEICAGQLIIDEAVIGNQMASSVAFIDAVESAQQAVHQ